MYDDRDYDPEEARRENQRRLEEIRARNRALREERAKRGSYYKYVVADAVEPEQEKEPTYVQTKKRSKGLSLVTLFLALCMGVLGAYLYDSFIKEPTPVVQEKEQPNITIATSEDMTVGEAVAKKALPSVVGITVVEEMRDFFGRIAEVGGVGSGVIIDSRGYILTNSHVIGDGKAKTISVLLDDGSTVPAELLWFDRDMDLAVIKVDKDNLPAAELGDSDRLQIGERAFAIGNPLGLAFNRSLTGGFISGVNRSIESQDGKIVDNLIQTDAAINRGNSGGPLLNSKGQVIGINTIKIGGQGTEGLGFAIPINTAKDIAEAVINHGGKNRVVLGIQMYDYQYYKMQARIENELDYGVIVVRVEKESNAERAGIQTDDIIMTINGVKVKSTDTLRTELLKYKEGDTITLHILRKDGEKDIQVSLE
ncbi:MAG: trypsin-like peptidase domain-containing protein [Tissierellia bacterium]|nr:trypsin-like peptidase domain-containing protein [Tissierellia bacterium]